MFASEPFLLDPEPHLGRRDPAGLDWHASWDCTTTSTTSADWDDPDGDDLDVELRALLDSVRRDEQPTTSTDDDPHDAALAAVLAEVAERTQTALVAERAAEAGSLTHWSDAAIVAEAPGWNG